MSNRINETLMSRIDLLKPDLTKKALLHALDEAI